MDGAAVNQQKGLGNSVQFNHALQESQRGGFESHSVSGCSGHSHPPSSAPFGTAGSAIMYYSLSRILS